MNELPTTFWISTFINLIVVIGGLAFSYGKLNNKVGSVGDNLDRLEVKQDKYNNLQERTVIVEQSTKSSHRRLDEFKKDFKEDFKGMSEKLDLLLQRAIK